MNNTPIDIVIPWVDGADPDWNNLRKQYDNYGKGICGANTEIRYQSWDNLYLWFRAIEKCMPWVHKIFFITYGHIPAFLDIHSSKLRIVRHEEYIPKEYLPTFNSNTIEMNLHRINELSENFILFNDDLFPLQRLLL